MLLLGGICFAVGDDYIEDEFEDNPADEFISLPVNNEQVAAKPPAVSARAAVAMDTETGRVLYAKNAAARMPMASITKIMTAIIALENGNMDDMVIVSKRAA